MYLTSEQKEFILAHEKDDVRDVALRFTRDDMPFLLSQLSGRKIAAKKVPSWYAHTDIIYPQHHLPLEQSSSEITARYKASLLSLNTRMSACGTSFNLFADLTGGMGVDFSFLAPYFNESIYVEHNEQLCRIARHNFKVLGLDRTTVYNKGTEQFLKDISPVDFIFIDPSRRDNEGRKLFRIEDCSPDLTFIQPILLEKSNKVMVKYSPMLDISLAIRSLACVCEVHVVSVDNECKELLFILSGEDSNKSRPIRDIDVTFKSEPLFIAVNLKRSGRKEYFTFTLRQEQNAKVVFADNPERYLYEPNASILKAGAFKALSEIYSLSKLHVNSHLYTSDKLINDFPGRIFEVESFFTPNKKNIKKLLQGTEKMNITVRNFPMTVADIRKKTGLKDGGDIYLFATTLSDDRKIWIVCKKS